MDALLKDLRFGIRQLRLSPMFTAVAILSLALGIGANTAIFQLIDAIRLRSLPVGNPQELAYLDFAKGSQRGGWWSTRSAVFTSAQWDSLQAHQQAFSGMIAWSASRSTLPGKEDLDLPKGCSSAAIFSTSSTSPRRSAGLFPTRMTGRDAGHRVL
jgi:hypothetical protein